MILPAYDRYLPGRSAHLAQVVVLNPDPGSLARSTALTRLSAGEFDLLTAGRRDELGHPIYWTIRPDGRAEMWPLPDRHYTVNVRDTHGRDPEMIRKPASVFPVMDHADAVNRQVDEVRQQMAEQAAQPAEAEHFRARPRQEADGE